MGRAKRILTNEFPYHISNHLVDEIYFTESELDLCLKVLEETKEKFNIKIISYNFMTNHYHIILQTSNLNLHKAMQYFNVVISKRYNKIKNRKGHLWRHRYYPVIIESDLQLLTCMRYVDKNPVEAKIVKDPTEWKWSSTREYFGIDNRNLITPPGTFLSLGDSFKNRNTSYKAMLEMPIDEEEIPKEWK